MGKVRPSTPAALQTHSNASKIKSGRTPHPAIETPAQPVQDPQHCQKAQYAALIIVAYLRRLGSVQGPASTARLVYIAIPAFIAIASMLHESRELPAGP